jgi:hypothetical protein
MALDLLAQLLGLFPRDVAGIHAAIVSSEDRERRSKNVDLVDEKQTPGV